MVSVAVPRWITPLTAADRLTSTVSPSSAVASARIVMGISADGLTSRRVVREGPGGGRVVLTGRGGAVGGGVVHRDRLAAAAGQRGVEREEAVGTTEGHLDLPRGRARRGLGDGVVGRADQRRLEVVADDRVAQAPGQPVHRAAHRLTGRRRRRARGKDQRVGEAEAVLEHRVIGEQVQHLGPGDARHPAGDHRATCRTSRTLRWRCRRTCRPRSSRSAGSGCGCSSAWCRCCRCCRRRP